MTDHKICDACECVAHCSKQGCIPLTEPVIRRAEGGAAETLAAIYDAFGIGSAARSPHILMVNIQNTLNRANCLSAIERTFFMVPTEPEEEDDGVWGEECLLNWGHDPDQYVKTFRGALKTINSGEAEQVFLVATGETHEGQETYTRHDVRPPLCDAEVLYTRAALQGGDAASEAALQELHNELYRAQITDNPVVLLEAVGKARLLLSRYRAALTSNSTEKSDGWLPIESAPKGRNVLVGYWNRLGKWRTVKACYYPPQSLELHEDHDLDEDGDGFAPEGWYEETETHEVTLPLECEPVHWQPLPTALTLMEAGMANDLNTAREQAPDDLKLTLLMAPYHLNLVVGHDRTQLLAFGRDVWAAAKRGDSPTVRTRNVTEANAPHAEWLKERADELVKRIHARIGTWGEQRKAVVDFAHEFAALAAPSAPPDHDAMGRLIGEASGGEGYEHYAAVREGHRNAAEEAWFSAIPDIDARRAFQAGFDAGYNTRDTAPQQSASTERCGRWVDTVIAWTAGGRMIVHPEQAQAMKARGFEVKEVFTKTWSETATPAPSPLAETGEAQNPKFTMQEWEAHARKHRWRFDLETPTEGSATALKHEGMTIAGEGASMLGALMREQYASRIGVYPDGNPNAALTAAQPSQSIGLAEQLATAVDAIEANHDPFCLSVLRGKECDCGAQPADGKGAGS